MWEWRHSCAILHVPAALPWYLLDSRLVDLKADLDTAEYRNISCLCEVTHHIVTVYLGCKNVYFELDIETHVGNFLRIGECYHFIVNIYCG
jgi:hypothetical protein